MEKEIILQDNPLNAIPETIHVYKSKNGKYYLTEKNAINDSITHYTCDCGEIYVKNSYCKNCSKKRKIEKYYAKVFQEWDGEGMVYSDLLDEFFTSESLEDYCKENSIQEDEDLMLIICIKNHYNELSSEYWSDIFPENIDEIPELEKIIDEFNTKLNLLVSPSYREGNFRTK